MQEPADFLNGTIRRWRDDARVFVRECLGAVPDAWQDHALALASNPRTRRLAMKACKGPGKTAVLAWIILWFLVTRWESKVGATSITEGNIDTNLWPELYKWYSRSDYLKATFSWTTTRVSRKGNPNWFAVKRTWPKSGDQQQQADALAGIHADDVMFVLDEAGGIPQAVMVTAEAVLGTHTEALELAGHRALVVISGNPTHTSGPLHRACTTDRKLWEVVTITGDPENPMRSPRISMKWALEEIEKYGRDNPWVMVNVLGEFPPASINALLGVEDVERAMRRVIHEEHYRYQQKRIGVDVARFGDDRSVIFPRQGAMSWHPQIMRNARTTAIAARVARGARNWGCELIMVDDTGHWGHGVIDQLITAGFPVMPVVYHERASDPHYKNIRTQMWLDGADAIKYGGAVLPYIPEMIPELTEITYTYVGGAFMLEDKDQVKARLGYSPDIADAYMTTYAMPEMPGEILAKMKGRNTALHDGNPYETSVRDVYAEEVGHASRDFDPLSDR